MKLKDRLKQRRLELNLTLEDIGNAVGVGKSTVRKWETGDIENMRRDKIYLLSKILQVPTSFFMEDDCDYNKHLDTLPTNAYPAELCRLPVIGRVSAGNGVLAEDNIIGYELADARYGNGDYFYLKVKGDSMFPKIEEGDLVLVHKQDSVDSGNYAVVVVNGEEGLVKQVKYDKEWIELISVNPYYPVRRFEGRDVLQVRVIGKVVKINREL